MCLNEINYESFYTKTILVWVKPYKGHYINYKLNIYIDVSTYVTNIKSIKYNIILII